MKKTLATGVFLALSAAALAQNLNPTVEVTNVYARETTGIEKPSQLLALPDSVYRFNLDFDYAVQRTPYKGAYEFVPYRIQLRPQPRPSTEGTLYVKAGAGFTLHPEASVVWTPLKKDFLRLNLYADHASFVGKFREIESRNGRLEDNGQRYGGFQTRTQLGADALLAWNGGKFSADLSYKDLGASLSGDESAHHHFFVAKARVGGNPQAAFFYDAGTRISLMGGPFRENHTQSDLLVGTQIGAHRFGLGAELESVSRGNGEYAGHASVVPRYLFELGRFELDLGAKISFGFRSDDTFYPRKSGIFFPDARVRIVLVPDALTAYASATGGDRFNVYSDLLEGNPYLRAFTGPANIGFDNSVERLNAALGLRGNIAGRFHFDLKGGYAWWNHAFLYGYRADLPVFGYADTLNKFYLEADLGWKSDYLDVDARVVLQHASPVYHEDNAEAGVLFAPAAFAGRLKALYKWGGRLRAGVTLDARSSAEAAFDTLPGYVDPGLYADFRMNARLAFWLRAGNLLGQTVQYVPGYAQSGAWLTVGVLFTL